MAAPTAKIGRPPNPAEGPKRFSLGLKVTAETKAVIDREARNTGRSQSQVAELLIEKALTYDQIISALNQSLEDVRRGQTEAAFQREGYRWVHSTYGKIWLPKDHPIGSRSDFVPVEEGEYVYPPVDIPPADLLPDNRNNPSTATKKQMARLDELEAQELEAQARKGAEKDKT
jgi:hypothetical protein